MKPGLVLRLGALALAAALILHQDLWLWNDPRRWLGLPVGLLYHVVLCLVASGIFAVMLRFGSGRISTTEEDERS